MKYIHIYELERCLKQRVLMCFMSAHARKLIKSYIPFSCSEISLKRICNYLLSKLLSFYCRNPKSRDKASAMNRMRQVSIAHAREFLMEVVLHKKIISVVLSVSEPSFMLVLT